MSFGSCPGGLTHVPHGRLGTQVGFINAMPSLVSLLLTPFIGWLLSKPNRERALLYTGVTAEVRA